MLVSNSNNLPCISKRGESRFIPYTPRNRSVDGEGRGKGYTQFFVGRFCDRDVASAVDASEAEGDDLFLVCAVGEVRGIYDAVPFDCTDLPPQVVSQAADGGRRVAFNVFDNGASSGEADAKTLRGRVTVQLCLLQLAFEGDLKFADL